MYVSLIAVISRSYLLLLTIALLRCNMFEALQVLNGGMIILYTQCLKSKALSRLCHVDLALREESIT